MELDKNLLFEFCADHIFNFNEFPLEYATFDESGEENNVYKYPDYLKFLTNNDISILHNLKENSRHE